MSDETYGVTMDRRLEPFTIKSLSGDGDWVTVTTTDSSGFGVRRSELRRPLREGGTYLLECVRWSQTCGIQEDGEWLWRDSDQDIARRDTEMRERFDRERRERLEVNRHDWERRSEALPDWLKARLRRFHDAAGEKFALDGWGYEIVVSELAWAYYDEDTERIEAIDREQGCSGNQHGYAKALAQLHRDGGDTANAVAALAPLTGSADYS